MGHEEFMCPRIFLFFANVCSGASEGKKLRNIFFGSKFEFLEIRFFGISLQK